MIAAMGLNLMQEKERAFDLVPANQDAESFSECRVTQGQAGKNFGMIGKRWATSRSRWVCLDHATNLWPRL